MSTEPKSVGLRTAQDNVDSRAAALRSAPSSQPDKASCEQSEKSQGGIPINRPGRLRSASRQATIRSGALVLLSVLAIMCILYVARGILFPILVAVIITFALRPIVRSLQRLRLPAAFAAGLTVALLMAIMGVAVFTLLGPASQWIEDAPENLRAVEYKLRTLREPIRDINDATEKVQQITGNGDGDALQVQLKPPHLANIVMNTTGSILVGTLVAVCLSFFLLAFGDRLLDVADRLTAETSVQPSLREMFFQIERGISQYLLTFTAINVCLGIVIGTGMWLIGMPNPVLWGVMAGCLNFMPYIGAFVGSGVVFLVAALSFDSMGQALLAPAIYAAANTLEGNVITPLILGRSMRLNPIFIFLSVVLWGWMWGVGGALIAVPLLAMTKIACAHSRRLQSVATLLES